MKKPYHKIREHCILTHEDRLFYYNSRTDTATSTTFNRVVVTGYVNDEHLTDNCLASIRSYFSLYEVNSLQQVKWFAKAIVNEKFTDFPLPAKPTPEEFLRKEGLYDLYKDSYPVDPECSFEAFLKTGDRYKFHTGLYRLRDLNGLFHANVQDKIFDTCFTPYSRDEIRCMAIDYIKKEINNNDL